MYIQEILDFSQNMVYQKNWLQKTSPKFGKWQRMLLRLGVQGHPEFSSLAPGLIPKLQKLTIFCVFEEISPVKNKQGSTKVSIFFNTHDCHTEPQNRHDNFVFVVAVFSSN